MSTTPTTPDMTAALQSVEAALSTGLKSLGSPSGASHAETPSAPAPAPPPAATAPEPAPVPTSAPASPAPSPAPVTAAPAPTPGSPAPSPSPSTTPAPTPTPASPVDLSSLSPAARRYLEMNGGDPDRALAKAIQDNNRLASFYRAHPELFAPGGPLDPKAPPQIPPDQAVLFTDPNSPATPTPTPGTSPATTPIPPAGTAAARPGSAIPGVDPEAAASPTPPPVEIDWAEVRTATDSYVQQDETCKNLVGAWTQNHLTVQQEQQSIDALTHDVSYLETIIKDESLSLSEVDKQDRIATLREKKSDLALLRQDVMLRRQEMRAQDVEFRGIRKQIQDSIASSRQQALQQQAQEAESSAYQAQAFQELSAQWEPALYRAAQSASIPPAMFERFKDVAKREAQARHAADETYYIDNVDTFVSEVARQFVGDMDAYHRAQSATYAALAAQRASAPSPTLPPGTPAPPPAPVRDLSPEEITDRLSSELRSGLRRSRV